MGSVTATATTVTYDATTNVWSDAVDLPRDAACHCVAKLGNDRYLLTGGWKLDSHDDGVADTHIIDLSVDAFASSNSPMVRLPRSWLEVDDKSRAR